MAILTAARYADLVGDHDGRRERARSSTPPATRSSPASWPASTCPCTRARPVRSRARPGRDPRPRQRRSRRGRDPRPARHGRRHRRRGLHRRDAPRRRRTSGSSRSDRSPTSRSRLRRDPGLANRVAGISIMGGGTFGNATAAAEFNIWADPEAAAVVFGSGARIRLCGLDLTHQVCADGECIAWIANLGTPLGDFVAGLLHHYAQRILELARRRPRRAARPVLGTRRDPPRAVRVREPPGAASSSTEPTPAA